MGAIPVVGLAPAPLHVAALQNQAANKASGGTSRLAQDFEAVFLTNMLEEMFAGLEDEDPFGGGAGSSTWRSLQTEEFARVIAEAGGIGLADHVQRQLIALQENQS
jgi:Rod binding domain-containing protein